MRLFIATVLLAMLMLVGVSADTQTEQFNQIQRRTLHVEKEAKKAWDAHKYNNAASLYKVGIAMSESAFGVHTKYTARMLYALAFMYMEIGDYQNAGIYSKKELAIREKMMGPNHPMVANSYHLLAMLHHLMGNYSKAEPLYKRAVAINEKAIAPDSQYVARILNDLALLYKAMGDYPRAIEMYERTLPIWEKELGPDHLYVATNLNNFGEVYRAMRDYSRAEPLYKKAIALKEKKLGPNHPELSCPLNNLGLMYLDMGDFARAEPIIKRALDIKEKKLGPNHPSIAVGLNSLAYLYEDMGEYSRAEPLFKRSIQIREKTHGSNNPLLASSLSSLAVLYLKMKKPDLALPLSIRANRIILGNIADTFTIASERQKLLFLGNNEWHLDVLLSAVTDMPRYSEAVTEALTAVLRFKGIVLEAMIGERETISRGMSPNLKAAYQKLRTTRQLIAKLYVEGPGKDPAAYRKEMSKLEKQKEQFEAQLSSGSAAFRKSREAFSVTPAAVCEKLPEDGALVEYTAFGKYGGNIKPYRVVAFVLEEGKCLEPMMVDLGPGKPIAAAVKEWREELQAFPSSGIKEEDARKKLDEKGKVIYNLIWRPINDAVQDKSVVYISPAGPLHLMPFGAMPVDGGYLIEKVNLGYVSSGRDFLRSKKPSRRKGILLVGGVDFDMGVGTQPQVASAQSSQRGNCGKLNELHWNALSGTVAEVDAISSSFRRKKIGVNVLKGADSREKLVLSGMQTARYIHLATHGFFLGDECSQTKDARGIGGVRPGESSTTDTRMRLEEPARNENPLLLSGLALGGANNAWKEGRGGGDDGYLLAMEVANLDLEGVELVTLSACQTGLGEIKRGEGVFGLKRSFMIAGAEALVMSLWSVPDKETKELMVDFYGRILSRNPKRESFRASQLKMLKSAPEGAYRHPYFWAAFQYIGVH